MTSLHYITHAVTLAVIATLVRKYLQVQYAYEELEETCHYHSDASHISCPGRIQEPSEDHAKSPVPEPEQFGTSIWCTGQNRTDRMCRFQNLCFNSLTDDFVFVHDLTSVIEGVDQSDIHNGMLELSTVQGHNVHYLRFVDLPASSLDDFSVSWIHEQTLIFNRFKPDNIMHVLHDDIFPLHYTLQKITFGTNHSEIFDVRLVFMEGWDLGEFETLYSYFTSHDILTKKDLSSLSELVCFKRGHVGISKKTTWYQYGFDKPQGGLQESTVTGRHIRNTVGYLLNAVSKEPCQTSVTEQDFLVLISRKENRLILNEPELVIAMASETGLKVVVVSFETHDVSEMMRLVNQSRGIIGMHGSLMILSAFLRPGSVVIELFPFAINPKNYTPFKSLALITGMNLVYKAWTNENREKSVMHPDWPPDLGGINYLSSEEQTDIINQSEVPLHLCCDDPSWLFHIYQDTTVDVSTVVKILKESLTESNDITPESNSHLLPGPVKGIICDVSSDVIVSWERPWNIKYMNHEVVEYELWLHDIENDTTLSIIVGDVSSYVITKHVISGLSYNVWVRCILNQSVHGLFSDAIKCVLT